MINFNSLIVSDYDGTIKKSDNLKEMIESLYLLRLLLEHKVGFMISTGRLYESMAKEIRDLNIPFNYLSCANGNILFDEYFHPLWKEYVNPKIIQELKPYYNHILSIDSHNEFGMDALNGIVEYVIYLKEDKHVRNEIVNLLLSSDTFDYCTDGESKYILHIFNLSSKVKTIEVIRNKLNMPISDIYTIGDGPNDLEMIKKYNGFIVGDALGDYEECALQKYESFYPFIKGVQQGLIKRRM